MFYCTTKASSSVTKTTVTEMTRLYNYYYLFISLMSHDHQFNGM